MRIFGRAVERHEKLGKEITDRFGTDGADLNEVLAWLCPLKNLHYDEITPDDCGIFAKWGKLEEI